MILVAELALPAAQGDAHVEPADLEQLVSCHFQFVWRLLRRLGLSASDADDAAQQVFLIASGKLSQIWPGRERAFLYGCALNQVAKWRHKAGQHARGVSLDSLSDVQSPDSSAEDLLDRAKARALLDRLLDELAPELRDVLVLYEVEQLSTLQI